MAPVPSSLAPSWSDLLSELLGLVFLRLPKRVDRAFFTAVCRTWCSAVRQCRLPLPSPVQWLMVPDGSATNFPRGETFQLPNAVRQHTSCGEWLLLSRHDGSCFLTNHFTKATMPLTSLSSCSYYQDLVEVDKAMDDWMWMKIKETGKISVLSLVVCSTRLVAAILAVAGLGTIALCRPGDAAWSVGAHMGCTWLSSMVFFQGKLYAFWNRGLWVDLIATDIVDENDSEGPRVSRIECLIQGDYLPNIIYSCYVHYLVESHGTLLMICRRHVHYGTDRTVTSELDVFKANIEQRLWVAVRTLENYQALFLGRGYSRAVCVSPYDLSQNCIFFFDCSNCFMNKSNTYGVRVYDMKDEKIYSPLPMVSWKFEKAPATWIFSPSHGKADKLQTAGLHNE